MRISLCDGFKRGGRENVGTRRSSKMWSDAIVVPEDAWAAFASVSNGKTVAELLNDLRAREPFLRDVVEAQILRSLGFLGIEGVNTKKWGPLVAGELRRASILVHVAEWRPFRKFLESSLPGDHCDDEE